MKKILSATLVALSLASGSHAQSIQLSDTVYSYNGDKNTPGAIYHYIKNVATKNIDMLVVRIEDNLAAGHVSYFCTGLTCYTPATDTSNVIPLSDGDSISFYVALEPNGYPGTSIITFSFYNIIAQDDSIIRTFIFNMNPTGISDQPTKGDIIEVFYPNTADAFIYFSFSLNAAAKKANIVIHNMLGSVVKNMELPAMQGMIVFPTSELKPGIYLYSLVVDDKTSFTRKLIITK